MKRFLATLAAATLVLGAAGCSDTKTSERQTTVTTPDGKTTVTTKQEVKKSGENPPPVNP